MSYVSADFLREIGDPRSWARTLLGRLPDEARCFKEHGFDEGTFGAWIKEGLRAEEGERTLAMLETLWNTPDAQGSEPYDDEAGTD
jgi:hypothetical protein